MPRLNILTVREIKIKPNPDPQDLVEALEDLLEKSGIEKNERFRQVTVIATDCLPAVLLDFFFRPSDEWEYVGSASPMFDEFTHIAVSEGTLFVLETNAFLPVFIQRCQGYDSIRIRPFNVIFDPRLGVVSRDLGELLQPGILLN